MYAVQNPTGRWIAQSEQMFLQWAFQTRQCQLRIFLHVVTSHIAFICVCKNRMLCRQRCFQRPQFSRNIRSVASLYSCVPGEFVFEHWRCVLCLWCDTLLGRCSVVYIGEWGASGNRVDHTCQQWYGPHPCDRRLLLHLVIEMLIYIGLSANGSWSSLAFPCPESLPFHRQVLLVFA